MEDKGDTLEALLQWDLVATTKTTPRATREEPHLKLELLVTRHIPSRLTTSRRTGLLLPRVSISSSTELLRLLRDILDSRGRATLPTRAIKVGL